MPLALALVPCLIWTPPAQADDLHVMTERYPPFSYQVDGEPRGFCVDLVRRILDRLGLEDTEIIFYPWARAYRALQEEDGRVLFPLSRSPAREHLFRFVGPVFEDTLYFYARRGAELEIASLDDARRVGAIGVTRDDFYHQFLAARGFTNLDVSTCQAHDFRKLAQGRVDLVPMGEKALAQFVGSIDGLDPAMFERVGPPVHTSGVYIGFSRSTPDSVLRAWRQALDDLKAAGVYDAVMNRYFPPADNSRP
ncbi:substrate-binding periplasmic protein [Pseudodesulfovibrio alkaliphilus]|uniref:substrate-binding periplasmic protein n=1 Tax=Pseudodesulfovibrio alkaliphilus TaxID=2661613 RepID=UPI0018C8A5B4|nr:transporter substrate-binding domain-containing protein [Pseudodesulfovibrio alkaliphilus]